MRDESGSDVDFDWDKANITHVARHDVTVEEAEQAILNDPMDLGIEVVDGEERFLSIGTTEVGRVLLVVTTWRKHRLRVVTAFEPTKRLVRVFYSKRGN